MLETKTVEKLVRKIRCQVSCSLKDWLEFEFHDKDFLHIKYFTHQRPTGAIRNQNRKPQQRDNGARNPGTVWLPLHSRLWQTGQTDPAQISAISDRALHGSILAARRDTMEEMKIPANSDGIAIARDQNRGGRRGSVLATRESPGVSGDFGRRRAPASQIYGRSKIKTWKRIGIFSQMLTPPKTLRPARSWNWWRS